MPACSFIRAFPLGVFFFLEFAFPHLYSLANLLIFFKFKDLFLSEPTLTTIFINCKHSLSVLLNLLSFFGHFYHLWMQNIILFISHLLYIVFLYLLAYKLLRGQRYRPFFLSINTVLVCCMHSIRTLLYDSISLLFDSYITYWRTENIICLLPTHTYKQSES